MAKKTNKKKQLQHEDTIDADDDDENTKDWWTKYFWSYEKLIEDAKEAHNTSGIARDDASRSKLGIKGAKLVAKLSPKHVRKVEKTKASTALCHVSYMFVFLYFTSSPTSSRPLFRLGTYDIQKKPSFNSVLRQNC